MSNPNCFNNADLPQTSIDSAYQFSSFSPYIMNGGLNSRFSPFCIFCSSNNTINLTNDCSFKQCNSCRKQFKAKLTQNQFSNGFSGITPYKTSN
jgi:hypothetical protein